MMSYTRATPVWSSRAARSRPHPAPTHLTDEPVPAADQIVIKSLRHIATLLKMRERRRSEFSDKSSRDIRRSIW